MIGNDDVHSNSKRKEFFVKEDGVTSASFEALLCIADKCGLIIISTVDKL
jgi:hypothetical protein